MEKHKKYSKKDDEYNDLRAKELAIDYLESKGLYKLLIPLKDQIQAFKHSDFEIYNNTKNRSVFVEVERKSNWKKTLSWEGFPTVDVSHRKEFSKSELFVMCNDTFDSIAITYTKNVLDAYVGNKDNKIMLDESFFRVDPSLFKFYHKHESGIWTDIN